MRRTEITNSAVTTPRITRKRASYSHRLADLAKEQRRQEGEARNRAWRELTSQEQITALAARPGESRKQVLRITGKNVSAKEALQQQIARINKQE